MKYTEDNIQGVKFKSHKSIYSVGAYNKTAYNIDILNEAGNRVCGYSAESIIAFLNIGTWIPIESTVINNYEIY